MIVGVCGLIGSGKGTAADVLVDSYGFQKLSFADKLKDAAAEIFGWDRDLLEGDTPHSRAWREQPDEFWTSELGKPVTPRLALQLLGTDCMRNGFYDGIWVSLVKQAILKNPQNDWVISDVRFPNEIRMIRSLQGEIWWVKRGELPQWFTDYRNNNIEPIEIHPSEWRWARTNFEYEIDNNGTPADLKNQVIDRLASSEHLLFARCVDN